MWLTVGLYDEPVRELLGFEWTARDQRRLRLFGRAVGVAFRLVPPRYRLHPRARAGWDTVRGRRDPGAAHVQTPARNLPPPEHRDDLRHYSPEV